jgi:hypothetical protein
VRTDTDFKQQRMAAWQPILTPKFVITFILAVGLLFLLTGGIIYGLSTTAVEFAVSRELCYAEVQYGSATLVLQCLRLDPLFTQLCELRLR